MRRRQSSGLASIGLLFVIIAIICFCNTPAAFSSTTVTCNGQAMSQGDQCDHITNSGTTTYSYDEQASYQAHNRDTAGLALAGGVVCSVLALIFFVANGNRNKKLARQQAYQQAAPGYPYTPVPPYNPVPVAPTPYQQPGYVTPDAVAIQFEKAMETGLALEKQRNYPLARDSYLNALNLRPGDPRALEAFTRVSRHIR